MAVTFDDVRHIAALARIAVPEDRVPALAAELSRILEHMEVLQNVETGPADSPARIKNEVGAEVAIAIADSEQGMPLRADGGVQYPLAAPRESFAPKVREGFLIVPRLATHEDEAE